MRRQLRAKAGEVQALHHFASMEIGDGNIEVGVHLFRLAASAGHKHSLEVLMKACQKGHKSSLSARKPLPKCFGHSNPPRKK